MQDYIPRKIDINERIGEIVVNQYENRSRFIHVRITDKDLNDGKGAPLDVTGCEARLYVKLGGDRAEYTEGEIADGGNGDVTFLIPGSVTAAEGVYECEIWLINPTDRSTLSTKPFKLRVEKSIRDDGALEAGESFSALENALLQVAVDRVRLNHLEAMSNSGTVVPGTVDSEVLDIRTAYDGTTYATAGSAVREQIKEIRDSVATDAEFLSVVGGDYEQNEEVAALVSDLRAVLQQAETFQTRLDSLGREFDRVAELIPNGGIGGGKLADDAVSAEKLSPALRNPLTAAAPGTVAEMLRLAETYFNYAYTANGEESGLLYERYTGLYGDSLGENAADGQYGIDGSAFVCALLNAISFENSRYCGNERNVPLEWGIAFDDTVGFGRADCPTSVEIDNKYLTAQALAQYAAEHGYLYPVDGCHKVRAGDIVFARSESGSVRGMDRCALVINADGEYGTLLEAQESQKTDIDGTQHEVGLRIRYGVPLASVSYGAAFPLGTVENEPARLESAYHLSQEAKETPSVVYDFDAKAAQGFYTVVCHGAFDAAPYVSLVYDGMDTETVQSVMHRGGSDYYLTVYAEQPAAILVKIAEGNAYAAEEITLYRGYAESTARAKGTVTLEMFGAVGDGVTDDTLAVQNAFDACGRSGDCLQGMAGKTYLIKGTVKITHNYFNFNGNGCTFTDTEDSEAKAAPVFDINTVRYTNRYAGEFGNFVLALNNRRNGVKVTNDARRLKSRIKIISPYEYGILTVFDSSSDYKNIYIEGDIKNARFDDTKGVVIGHADCYFSTVDMANIKTMWRIETNGNVMLDHCHGFLGEGLQEKIYKGSTYISVQENLSPSLLLNQCYFDNTQYGFQLTGSSHPRVQMTCCYQYTASAAITADMLRNMQVYFLHSELVTASNRFNLIGCTLYGSQNSAYPMQLTNHPPFRGVTVGCLFAGDNYMEPHVNCSDYSSFIGSEYARPAVFTAVVKNQAVYITGDIEYNPATDQYPLKISTQNVIAEIGNETIRPIAVQHFLGYVGVGNDEKDEMTFNELVAITVTPDGYIRLRGQDGSDACLFGSDDITYHIVFSASWCMNI